MKKKIKIFLSALSLLCLNAVIAQSKTVSGNVTDANDGSPLPGVSIIVQGTTNGTQTDFDGNYSIDATVGEVLVFSYIGMKTQTLTIGNSNTIDIAMQEDASQLEEVVVTALGIKREERALGYAVSEIQGDEIAQVAQINPINAMQGKTAGVQISTTSGGT
ncbi:MAG: carboxypeptidase-like regulatory domain-containing protein, partial [Arenibacter sp.]